MRKYHGMIAAIAACALVTPAMAKDEAPELITCEASMGTVALVEGDEQGWTEFGLGSPRELVNALVTQSGCFTVHQAGVGGNATYLLNVIAGSEEEVDKSIELAKSAATEGLIRSGAAGSLLGNVPIAGSLLGAFSMFGGKKKTVAAGVRLISPANGLTLASGSGSVKKSTLAWGGGNAWSAGAAAAGYDSKNGKMLTEAFVIAFNSLVAQQGAISSQPVTVGAAAEAVIAADTNMLAEAKAGATSLRKLRKGTTLNPTGKRDGLFVEMSDGFGTTGWVSVEDLE